MSDFSRIAKLAKRLAIERMFSMRMYIMLPILVLFIPGMPWGFSDPDIVLPGGHQPENAMEVLFYASLGVVFGARWPVFAQVGTCRVEVAVPVILSHACLDTSESHHLIPLGAAWVKHVR